MKAGEGERNEKGEIRENWREFWRLVSHARVVSFVLSSVAFSE